MTAEVSPSSSMNNPTESPAESRPVIEPAQMQFIEANFNDFLGARPTDCDSMKASRPSCPVTGASQFAVPARAMAHSV